MKMFCKKCGNQIADNMQFCSKCGTPAAVQNSQQTENFTNHTAPQQKPMTQRPMATQQNVQPQQKEYMTANSAQLAQQQVAPKAPPAGYTNAFPKPKVAPPEEYEQVQQPQYAPNAPVANYPDPVVQDPGMNNQPPAADPPAPKAKKPKKNIGLRIVAIILVLAVLATGGLFLADFIAYKVQMDGAMYIGIDEFPVLKQNTEFRVIDPETFPVDEYEIKVEELKGGGILRSKAFVGSRAIIKEKSKNPIYNIKFPSNGNFRITLTEIKPSVRTNTLPSTTTTTTTTTTQNSEEEVVIIIVIDVKVDDNDPEARDKVSVNSRVDEEETTAATTAVNGNQTPSSNGAVEVTDADFKTFESMVKGVMPETIPEFNCNTASAQYVTENLITDFLNIPGYTYFFGTVNPKRTVLDGYDPLNKWSSYNNNDYSYWMLDEDNVKWICENIFHVSYTTGINSEKLYSHNGYVYKYQPVAGGFSWDSITVESHIQSGDKYKIRVRALGEYSDTPEYYDFTTDMQMINGKKQWTIYAITKVDPDDNSDKPTVEAQDADFEELANFLLAINYTEYNNSSATTDFVVEKILTNEISAFGYEYFFGEISKTQSVADPLNKFGTSYMIMDADNIKWFCEDILNVRYDPSYNTANSYVLNGKVYRKSVSGSETENYFSTPTSYEVQNKRYVVESQFWSAPIGHEKMDGTEKLIGTYEIVAELKEIDGQRVWSIYSIKKIS